MKASPQVICYTSFIYKYFITEIEYQRYLIFF